MNLDDLTREFFLSGAWLAPVFVCPVERTPYTVRLDLMRSGQVPERVMAEWLDDEVFARYVRRMK